jgi:hypothetical protein
MNKYLERILLGISDNDEIADDEIDALGITHFGEVIGNAF